MQYLALIYSVENSGPKPETPEFGDYIGQYRQISQDWGKSGTMVAGDALQPVSTATTIRIRNGKTETIDGPFAETKEQLGGYYLLECENLDAALKEAAKIPTVHHGSIEVRPVMVWDN